MDGQRVLQDSQRVLQDGLYRGTIQQEDPRLQERDDMPSRSNPYKYYELAPDYYDYWRKHRAQLTLNEGQAPAARNTDSRHFRKQATPTPKKQPEVSRKMCASCVPGNKDIGKTKNMNRKKNQIHPQPKQNIQMVNYDKLGSMADEERFTVVESRHSDYSRDRDDTVRRLREDELHVQSKQDTVRRLREDELQSKQNPTPRSNRAVSNQAIVYNPMYRHASGHVLQPLLHVRDPDIVHSLPVVRVKHHEIKGNPLIPVKIPADYVTDPDPGLDLPNYGHDVDYYYESEDDVYSLFICSTDIPSYKAVDSVLTGYDW